MVTAYDPEGNNEVAPERRTLSFATTRAAAGELDLVTAPLLRQDLERLISAGHHDLVVDFAAVTFMDSTGLSSLMAVLGRVQAVGGSLSMSHPCAQVRDLLKLTGVDAFIRIVESPGSTA